jgi:polyhydroxybutyrate depolymerase
MAEASCRAAERRPAAGFLILVVALAVSGWSCDLTGDPPANSRELDGEEGQAGQPDGLSVGGGCGADDVSIGTNNVAVETGGARRAALIYVPHTYDANRPTPVLLSFHRAGATASQHQGYANFVTYSEQAGFIVALPYADINVGSWRTTVGARADVEFIEDLLSGLAAEFCVDPARIYAVGFSDGAVFAHLLACSGTRLAGLAAVALQRTDPCPAARPLAVVGFHGTADPIQPFDAVQPDQWAEGWAQTNGCDVVPIGVSAAESVRTSLWTNCQEGSPVAFYILDGGGHTWPGADSIDSLGPTIDSIDASAEIARFFGLID